MSSFYDIEPTPESYWRAIILFGRNTASYKFALAKALLDLQRQGKSSVTLTELALPYAQHLCQHLLAHPKQSSRDKSTFLQQLHQFNLGKIDQDQMIYQTVRHGFNYVLEAFHNVHGTEIERPFFSYETGTEKRLHLTNELFKLTEPQRLNLERETEARWQLVEAAWENNLSRNLMLVEYEDKNQRFIGVNSTRRVNITSARPALNGYQKGRCFYCFCSISVVQGSDDMADVDHFFPHKLKQCDTQKPIDGVANLVLSCQKCNRGVEGKFDKLPALPLLDRLFKRNEYLISSHHPLRETLISQIGNSVAKRQRYLQEAYNCSTMFVGAAGRQKWQPIPQATAIF